MAVLLSQSVCAGERCIAIDGDTLVCNHQKVRLTNVYAAELNQAGGSALAEVYVDGKRIEQADIGPRAGRGVHWRGDQHRYLRIRKVRFAAREPRIVAR